MYTPATRSATRPLPAGHARLVLGAVHDDVRAADPRRARREQEARDVRDLLGRPEPAVRELVADPLPERLRVARPPLVPAAAREEDRPRAQRVDPDPVGAELAAQRRRE